MGKRPARPSDRGGSAHAGAHQPAGGRRELPASRRARKGGCKRPAAGAVCPAAQRVAEPGRQHPDLYAARGERLHHPAGRCARAHDRLREGLEPQGDHPAGRTEAARPVHAGTAGAPLGGQCYGQCQRRQARAGPARRKIPPDPAVPERGYHRADACLVSPAGNRLPGQPVRFLWQHADGAAPARRRDGMALCAGVRRKRHRSPMRAAADVLQRSPVCGHKR